MIEIRVNGVPTPVADRTTISNLLTQLSIQSKAIAVERNGEIVQRDNFNNCELEPCDSLEIVTLVGGG